MKRLKFGMRLRRAALFSRLLLPSPRQNPTLLHQGAGLERNRTAWEHAGAHITHNIYVFVFRGYSGHATRVWHRCCGGGARFLLLMMGGTVMAGKFSCLSTRGGGAVRIFNFPVPPERGISAHRISVSKTWVDSWVEVAARLTQSLSLQLPVSHRTAPCFVLALLTRFLLLPLLPLVIILLLLLLPLLLLLLLLPLPLLLLLPPPSLAACGSCSCILSYQFKQLFRDVLSGIAQFL